MSASSRVGRSRPWAGAGLRIVVAPARAAEAERLVGRPGPDLVADEHDVALLERETLERGADLDGVECRVRAAGHGDGVLAGLVDHDQRDPGRLARERHKPGDIDAFGLERGRAPVPNASSPTAPTKSSRRPSRAAATAWLPPLPPWCCANRPPMTVSPGPGSCSVVTTRSTLTEPTTMTRRRPRVRNP